jgi:carbohydrate diacid regulator
MSTLTPDVAQRIVDRTMAVIGHNVNVMDDRGVILATGDPGRRLQQHEGALVAAHGDRVVAIDDGQARLLKGVQPGVNVPLHHRGEVVGVVGISGDPQEVRVLAELIRVTAELIVDQAALLESGRRREQEVEDHLIAVVDGSPEPSDAEAAARRGTELGIEVDVRRCCTVVRPTAAADPSRALRSVQRRLAGLPGVLVARVRPDELAVWWSVDQVGARTDVHAAVAAEADDLLAVDGEAHGGVDGLRRAWVAAQDLAAVAHLDADLYERHDLALVALLCRLRDDRRAEAVAAPWLALVAADRHGELRATLRAWIRHDLNPGRCAAALHVHRNTLRGRLERIERVTGLELARVASILQLYVGPLLVLDEAPG